MYGMYISLEWFAIYFLIQARMLTKILLSLDHYVGLPCPTPVTARYNGKLNGIKVAFTEVFVNIKL